jgi:hypothetical protein
MALERRMDMNSGMRMSSDSMMDSPGRPSWRVSAKNGPCSQGWGMEQGATAALGLSVFGFPGDRFSIVVIPADSFPEQKPGSDVEWSLIRPSGSGEERVLFALQWTMEMRGSGCLALCGREMPVFPVRPA